MVRPADRPTDRSLSRLFDRTHALAEERLSDGHGSQIGLQFVPHHLIRVRGRAGDLDAVQPALSHRLVGCEADGVAPDLDLLLLTKRDLDTLVELLPSFEPTGTDGGRRWFEQSARRFALLHESFATLHLYDRRRRAGALLVVGEHFPYPTLTSPFLPILHWHFADRGLQVLHAAGLQVDGRTLLVIGRGGAGKSTAALRGLEAGFGFLGDDMILCHLPGPERAISVSSLFRSAKVEREDLGSTLRIAGIELDATRGLDGAEGPDPKGVVFVDPTRVPTDTLEVSALIVPTRVLPARIPSGSRLPASVSFMHLAPNVLMQLPGDRERATRQLRAIATAVPAYALDLGAPEDIASRLQRFVASLDRARTR